MTLEQQEDPMQPGEPDLRHRDWCPAGSITPGKCTCGLSRRNHADDLTKYPSEVSTYEAQKLKALTERTDAQKRADYASKASGAHDAAIDYSAVKVAPNSHPLDGGPKEVIVCGCCGHVATDRCSDSGGAPICDKYPNCEK